MQYNVVDIIITRIAFLNIDISTKYRVYPILQCALIVQMHRN